MVAGVVALMLQANPNLTWRDVQHILVETALQVNPFDSDWVTNAADYLVNQKYGFGLVDADGAVALAQTWTNVAPETSYAAPVVAVNKLIPSKTIGSGITSSVLIPANLKVEHVEVVFNAVHSWRGDLEINLTSPSGTRSQLMTVRPYDGESNYPTGTDPNFTNWKFMTVHSWGEHSGGTWTIEVVDRDPRFDVGTFQNWQIIVYGTPTTPKVPTLTTPADATNFTITTPVTPITLTWDKTSTFGDHLELQIDTVNPPVHTITIPGVPSSLIVNRSIGTHYWRVRAVDGSGLTSPWSPVRSFSVVTKTGAAPMLNFFMTSTPLLTWNLVTGAVRYEVQVARNVTFTTLAFPTQTVNAPSVSFTTPSLEDGIYYWRVRACSSLLATSCGAYGTADSFAIVTSP
jgi:subtilisin-like proprotein convertase family protein